MEMGGEAAGAVAAAMAALEASWLGAAMRGSTWLYPLASVLHILGLAFLLGAIAVFDLRVLGWARRLPLDASAAFLLPVARAAFAVQLVTGVLMFSADASHLYGNVFLLAKLALIVAALANITWFHARLRADPAFHDRAEAPAWARRSAAASLGLWIGVASFGRMIAYV